MHIYNLYKIIHVTCQFDNSVCTPVSYENNSPGDADDNDDENVESGIDDLDRC